MDGGGCYKLEAEIESISVSVDEVKNDGRLSKRKWVVARNVVMFVRRLLHTEEIDPENLEQIQSIPVSVAEVKNDGGPSKGKWVVARNVIMFVGRLLQTEEIDPEKLAQERKTVLIVSTTILAVDCNAMTSLPSSVENRDKGVRQIVVLIPVTLSFIYTLCTIVVLTVATPSSNLSGPKRLVVVSAVFTGISYSAIAFDAMKLEPISKEIVIAMFVAGASVLTAMVLSCNAQIKRKSAQPDLGAVDNV